MKLTKEFSEIIGMFAADGCLQNNYICMWGNIVEDKDYYNRIVCPLFSKVFNKTVTAHEKKSNSVYGFYLCDKNVVMLFRSLGFTNKKTYTVSIPKEIIENDNEEIIAAFIRGFADCDGSIYFQRRKGKYKQFKLKYHTYPKIELRTVSKEMSDNLSHLLDKLNISHTKCVTKSKKPNEKPVNRVIIRGPERIESFMKKVGFNNPVQYSKYLIWKKFGLCPIRTNLEQRKFILNNELDPYSFYKTGLEGLEPSTPSLEG